MKGQTSPARGAIIRDAVIFTPFFVLFAVAWVAALVSEGGGAIPLLVILGLITVLAGFQAVQALLDLVAAPQTTKGEVSRKWKRADLFVFQGHYLYVGKKVFRVDPLTYQQLEPGDRVTIAHYPHTNVVVSVEKEG